MIIPIHYTYTNYPLAPKATAKSKFLGYITSIFPMVLWSFFFIAIISYILKFCGMEEDMGTIIGVVFVIPFIFFILKRKKYRAEKIDECAQKEAKQNVVLMTAIYRASFYLAQPFTQSDIKEKCPDVTCNNATLQFALQKLVESRKFKSQGKGKKTCYYRVG